MAAQQPESPKAPALLAATEMPGTQATHTTGRTRLSAGLWSLSILWTLFVAALLWWNVAHVQRTVLDLARDAIVRPHERLAWVAHASIWVAGLGLLAGVGGQVRRRWGDRAVAFAALREGERRFRTIFEDSPVAIWEQDFSAVKARFDELRERGVRDLRDYLEQHPEEVASLATRVRVVEINQTSVRLFGAESKEQVARELPRYFTAESLAVFKEQLVALAQGQTRFAGEAPLLGSRGQALILELTLSVQPGHEDTLSRVLVTLVDVSERRRAEAALRESEERLRAIIATEPECVKLVSASGLLLEMNPAGLAMLQAGSLEEARQLPLVAYLQPDYRAGFLALHARVMRGETGKLEYEVTGLRGATRWLETHATPWRDARGRVLGLLGVTRDVTERKRAEAKLLDQLDELRRWQKVMLEQSDRSQELKREVNELARRLGEPIRYPSQAEAEDGTGTTQETKGGSHEP